MDETRPEVIVAKLHADNRRLRATIAARDRNAQSMILTIAKQSDTIAALLAVPDEMRATGLSHSVHLSMTRRMAAVVEGER